MKKSSWPVKILLLLIVIASSNIGIAQNSGVLALMDSLENTTDGKVRVDLMNAIAGQSMEVNLDLAISTAREARTEGLEQEYLKGIADANKWLGKGNALKGRNAEALHNFMDALVVYEQLSDSLEMANVYKYLANVYTNNGNDREAMRYYRIAQEIYSNLQDSKGNSSILNNIGTIYLTSGDADSALYYLNQSRLSYLELKDESGLATNYTNMGYAYSIKEDHIKAIDYYNKSYELAKKLDIKQTMSTALNNVGNEYMLIGEYEKAEEFVAAGIKIAEDEGYKVNVWVGYYTMGEVNEHGGNYKESVAWYHKAEDVHGELRNEATLNALMDFQTMQLEQAQRREIEKINSINQEKIQSARLKNLLYLSTAIFALLMLLGVTYYFMKRHKATLKISIQNKEINSQKHQIEAQSAKIKQVNDTLRVRNKKLRDLNEQKNYMMNVVAHDLKSPLNQINGLANVISLDDDNLNSTQKECLDNISVASSRLKEMIEKILDSRTADKMEKRIDIESIDVEAMANEVLSDFSVVANNKNIKLSKKSSSKTANVKADKHYLRQVLDNLVSNAIKFSPEGKSVNLNIFDEGDKILAEIQDEGPGLTSEDQEQLFTEYAVLSAKPTGNEVSTGLGLAIAKNYVEEMGGEIWCESEHGHGASFKFKLDRADLNQS